MGMVFVRRLYAGDVILMEDILEGDLATASEIAVGIAPDIVDALDRLAPLLAAGGDRSALRRYLTAVDAAARVLTTLPSSTPEAAAPAAVVYRLLCRNAAELVWVAPSVDGRGILTALVGRFRALAGGGVPQPGMRVVGNGIAEHRFCWLLESIDGMEFEQRCGSLLRRAMAILGLSSGDVAGLMGVTRQAVDKWLIAGPPVERMDKIAAIAGISSILRHRLREGMPPAVVRRPAEAYGGRCMLEVIADDEHEWLHRSVAESFDFARTA